MKDRGMNHIAFTLEGRANVQSHRFETLSKRVESQATIESATPSPPSLSTLLKNGTLAKKRKGVCRTTNVRNEVVNGELLSSNLFGDSSTIVTLISHSPI